MSSSLRFDTSFDATVGTAMAVTDGIVRITAPNASAYTFTGTNSFLLGTDEVAIVDPGPDDDHHFDALLSAINDRPVTAILLTHTHKDHSSLAGRLAAETRAPVWFGGAHRLSRPLRPGETNVLEGSCDWNLHPDRTLLDGDVLQIGEMTLNVVATPGHCANHLAFGISGTPCILTGDHVMGWNSTLVAVPDGSMADYLRSLDKLIATDWQHYLPAHGGPIGNGPTFAQQLKAHRLNRNTEILNALTSAPMGLTALRERIYPDLPEEYQKAALMTLEAHLEYLEEQGAVLVQASGAERLYSPKR